MGYTKWSTAKQIKAMRDLNELDFHGDIYYKSPPTPTQEDYDHIKKHYDIEIPHSLKKLLEFRNGGTFRVNLFPSTNSSFRGRMIINILFSLKLGYESNYSMVNELNAWRPYIGPKGLPFADDPGGDLFFLDTSKEPAVVKYVMHDFDMKVITIAKDFETFIDGLIPRSDDEDEDNDYDKEVNYLYDGDAEEDILDDEDDYDDEEDDDSSEEEKKP